MDFKLVSTADRQAIEAELEKQRLDHQWAIAPSLDQLVEKWRRFVGEVEAGYTLSVYDYTEDLSTRDILDRLLEVISNGRGSNPLRAELSPLDDRFRLATRRSEVPVAPGAPGEPLRLVDLDDESDGKKCL